MRRGSSLLETVIGMALLAVLLAALLKMLGGAVITTEYVLTGIEMREEAVGVIERLEHEMALADKLVISDKGSGVTITRDGKMSYYKLDNQKAEGRITKNTQPVTGENTKLEISFKKFLLTPVSANAVKLELLVRNQKTNQELALETIIPCMKLQQKLKGW